MKAFNLSIEKIIRDYHRSDGQDEALLAQRCHLRQIESLALPTCRSTPSQRCWQTQGRLAAPTMTSTCATSLRSVSRSMKFGHSPTRSRRTLPTPSGRTWPMGTPGPGRRSTRTASLSCPTSLGAGTATMPSASWTICGPVSRTESSSLRTGTARILKRSKARLAGTWTMRSW